MQTPQPARKFIDLDLMPLGTLMLVETLPQGGVILTYELWREEDGFWRVSGGHLDEDVLLLTDTPYIAGFGKPAQFGHVTTAPVIFVGFEPMGDDNLDDFTPSTDPMLPAPSLALPIPTCFVIYESAAELAKDFGRVLMPAGVQPPFGPARVERAVA
jgi:hypothetical protein